MNEFLGPQAATLSKLLLILFTSALLTIVPGTTAMTCPTPEPNTVGICVEMCNSETDPCPGEQLCCSNGCGHVCMDPVPDVGEVRIDSVCDPIDGYCIKEDNNKHCLLLEQSGCTSEDMMVMEICPVEYDCIKTMFVGPEQVDCVGMAPQKCYMVKFDDSDNEWQYFYDQIINFEWKEGYESELHVRVIPIENPPADASSIRYKMVEMVNQIETTTTDTTPVDDDDECPSGFGVIYAADSAELCAVIKFKCSSGLEPFSGPGDCGCGCKPLFCGGIAGVQCPDGSFCVDDPDDDCDPLNGGADCGGLCQPVAENVCLTQPCNANADCTIISGCEQYTCDRRYPIVTGFDGICSLYETTAKKSRCKVRSRNGRGGSRRAEC